MANPLGLTAEALDRRLRPPAPARRGGWKDEILGMDVCVGAGFALAPPGGPGRFWAVPGGFGSPGAGGALGYCGPDAEVAHAYVPNRCGMRVLDPQDHALRDKMYRAVQQVREAEGLAPLNIAAQTEPHYLTRRYIEIKQLERDTIYLARIA